MKQWQEAKLQQLDIEETAFSHVRYPDILHGKKIMEMVEMAVTVELELTAYHNNSIF